MVVPARGDSLRFRFPSRILAVLLPVVVKEEEEIVLVDALLTPEEANTEDWKLLVVVRKVANRFSAFFKTVIII